MKIEELSLNLAEVWHKGQLRKDGITPYIEHPKSVVALLLFFGVRQSDVIAAAYAHDLLEDTDISEKEIEEVLGLDVLKRVKALTHMKGVSKEEYLMKLSKDDDIFNVLIKAADRMCNTYDFICLGKSDYAKKYFCKAEAIFLRIEEDSSILADIYTSYLFTKRSLEGKLCLGE